MHQGCPRMDILCAASEKARRLFRLPIHCGNFEGDAVVVAWVRCKNPGALPPFPTWEEVLAIETGDSRITDSGVFPDGWVQSVTKSITETKGIATQDFTEIFMV